jgi:hypothetical protein
VFGLDLDQQVHVARRAEAVAQHGAEKRETADFAASARQPSPAFASEGWRRERGLGTAVSVTNRHTGIALIHR